MLPLTIVTLTIVAVYWGATLLYVLPDNPIRDRSAGFVDGFEVLFFQRWNFFAPPPTANTRLYYRFPYEDSTRTFEVLRDITAAKRAAAPFNTEEETVDYILHGSVADVKAAVRAAMGESRRLYPDSTERFHTQQAIDLVSARGRRPGGLVTLYNYACFVARAQGLHPIPDSVQIVVTDVPIVPFERRKDSTYVPGPPAIMFATPVGRVYCPSG